MYSNIQAASWLLCYVVALWSKVGDTSSDTKTYCKPDESCWPSQTSIDEFTRQLTGDVYFPKNKDSSIAPGTEYYKLTYDTIMSRRWLVKPGMIVVVQNEADIQRSIKFAMQYNIRISVISSGHDFIGRNTAAGSLQINLSKLSTIHVNVSETAESPGGTVTVGVGTNWKTIYHALSSYNRVVVGGNSPLVSPGGYTLGGGHSPLTRKLGLAVDNVIWIQIITADGKIAHVSKDGYTLTDENNQTSQHTDQDFFWALRGGGGGTFGIATQFKYKIHFPADKYTTMFCSWAFSNRLNADYAKDFLNFFAQAQQQLTDEWGGYLLLTTPIDEIPALYYGGISVAFTYWGNYSAAYESSAMFRKYQTDHPERVGVRCTYEEFSTFWKRQQNVSDTSYGYGYIFSINIEPNTWSQSFSQELADAMWSASQKRYYLSATGTMTGRKSRTFSDSSSSVVPSFRNADMVMTFGTSWEEKSKEDWAINTIAKPAAEKVYKFVNGGYLNEPDSEKEDWKTFYWGTNYDRLLSIKNRWDPNNTFTCRHCVGAASSLTHSVLLVLGMLLLNY